MQGQPLAITYTTAVFRENFVANPAHSGDHRTAALLQLCYRRICFVFDCPNIFPAWIDIGSARAGTGNRSKNAIPVAPRYNILFSTSNHDKMSLGPFDLELIGSRTKILFVSMASTGMCLEACSFPPHQEFGALRLL